MKIIRGLLDLHYPDVPPEIAIDREVQFLRCERFIHDDVRNLSFGMDSGVGASGTDHRDLRIVEHSDYAFELALDRAIIILHLPAMEVGAVVLDEEFVVQGSCRLSVVSRQ